MWLLEQKSQEKNLLLAKIYGLKWKRNEAYWSSPKIIEKFELENFHYGSVQLPGKNDQTLKSLKKRSLVWKKSFLSV